jgi:hypothetical protein
MVAAASFPRPTPSDAVMAPDDDERIAIIVIAPIEEELSQSDRYLLQYIEHVRRVMVERTEGCEVCGAHHVLYCDSAPPHVDVLTVHRFVSLGLIDIEFDRAQRMYFTATATLSVFLHPLPPGKRRKRKPQAKKKKKAA